MTSTDKWIACSERLPDVGADILVYDPTLENLAERYPVLLGRMTHSWGIAYNGQNGENPHITHWMPLPSPPATGEKP